MVGEQRLNTWLRDYAQKMTFRQNTPFTTTDEWYSSIYAQAPDSLKYFVEDCIKKIALYENKVTKVEATPLQGDQYQSKTDRRNQKTILRQNGQRDGPRQNRQLHGHWGICRRNHNKLGMKQKVPLYLKSTNSPWHTPLSWW
ncbi:MAG: hypothetical protein R2822_24820 [Spirosomataceae bacterium]